MFKSFLAQIFWANRVYLGMSMLLGIAYLVPAIVGFVVWKWVGLAAGWAFSTLVAGLNSYLFTNREKYIQRVVNSRP